MAEEKKEQEANGQEMPAVEASVSGETAAKQHRTISKQLRSNLITYGIVIAFYIVIMIMDATGVLTNSLSGQLVPICTYVCAALSLNLVVGISGELSLGHAGFMSVGAFSSVVASTALSGVLSGVPLLLVSMLIGGLFAALAGLIVGIPVMRLHGDYLAIVTLAFGEIIKNVINNLYVGVDSSGIHFSMTDSASLNLAEGGTVVINGPRGATGIDRISTFTVGIVLVLITLTIVLNLVHSRTGRAIMAVRDNRIAAESVGVNSTKYRLIAFVVAAALAGMAGAFYAHGYTSVTATKFNFNTSIYILVYVVLGGIGSMRGSIIAAAFLTVLPEMLRAVNEWRMLVYSIVLIAVMLLTNSATGKSIIAHVKNFFLRIWAKITRKSTEEEVVADAD